MSGHSKWSQIKRQKGVTDVKRGQTFTKVANSIIVAVKEGGSGDPSTNFRLAQVLESARTVNMPKDNIQRAIDRGLGKGEAANVESLMYEAYGPAGVALLIEVVTDNRNRTAAEVKSTVEKTGGTMGGPGSVAWMFEKRGLVAVSLGEKSFDEVFEIAAESGASDVEEAGDTAEVYSEATNLKKVQDSLKEQNLPIDSAEIVYKPTQFVDVSDVSNAKTVINLMDKLDNLDDVVRVSANFNIPDEILENV